MTVMQNIVSKSVTCNNHHLCGFASICENNIATVNQLEMSAN